VNPLIFPGRQLANQKLQTLAKKVKRLRVVPKLQILLIGSDPASRLYVKLKTQAAEKIGTQVQVKQLPSASSPSSVIQLIQKANRNPHSHGIMVQLPLPKKLQPHQTDILSAINPAKDVDCLTPENLGLLISGQPRFLPATTLAVLTALEYAAFATGSDLMQIQNPPVFIKRSDPPHFSRLTTHNLTSFLPGKRVVILGAGLETGKPLANLLSHLGATVLWATITETNLKDITRQADILISATGQPHLITKNHVKKGVIAIDIGSSKDPKTGKPTGDLNFNSVKQKASFITPIPGGIGPLTVASLLENLLQAAQLQVSY
jgi:methylenetetrahydrofolate dehydrogenase (NADP+)/methenyltetrahydrofolate cyclohydrolase